MARLALGLAFHRETDHIMNKHTSLAAAVFVAVLSLPLLASAQDRDQTRDQTRDQLRDTTQSNVYGWQLMTRQERAEYRARMRSLRRAQERERFRREHHERTCSETGSSSWP